MNTQFNRRIFIKKNSLMNRLKRIVNEPIRVKRRINIYLKKKCPIEAGSKSDGENQNGGKLKYEGSKSRNFNQIGIVKK